MVLSLWSPPTMTSTAMTKTSSWHCCNGPQQPKTQLQIPKLHHGIIATVNTHKNIIHDQKNLIMALSQWSATTSNKYQKVVKMLSHRSAPTKNIICNNQNLIVALLQWSATTKTSVTNTKTSSWCHHNGQHIQFTFVAITKTSSQTKIIISKTKTSSQCCCNGLVAPKPSLATTTISSCPCCNGPQQQKYHS